MDRYILCQMLLLLNPETPHLETLFSINNSLQRLDREGAVAAKQQQKLAIRNRGSTYVYLITVRGGLDSIYKVKFLYITIITQ